METGRFFVVMKSGRKFCVEPYGKAYTYWGNVIGNRIERVEGKQLDVIDESNTVITKENGYKNICFLDPGTSPVGFIETLDASGLERIECEGVTYI